MPSLGRFFPSSVFILDEPLSLHRFEAARPVSLQPSAILPARDLTFSMMSFTRILPATLSILWRTTASSVAMTSSFAPSLNLSLSLISFGMTT